MTFNLLKILFLCLLKTALFTISFHWILYILPTEGLSKLKMQKCQLVQHFALLFANNIQSKDKSLHLEHIVFENFKLKYIIQVTNHKTVALKYLKQKIIYRLIDKLTNNDS